MCLTFVASTRQHKLSLAENENFDNALQIITYKIDY